MNTLRQLRLLQLLMNHLSPIHLIIIFLKKLLCKMKIDVILISAPKKKAL